jgi:uncharacterized membrane protein YgdD (TMEM256/DUF423 family)
MKNIAYDFLRGTVFLAACLVTIAIIPCVLVAQTHPTGGVLMLAGASFAGLGTVLHALSQVFKNKIGSKD